MEILNTIDVPRNWFVGTIGFVLIMLMFGGFFFTIGYSIDKKLKKALASIIVMILSTGFFVLLNAYCPLVKQHEVVLHDGTIIDATKYTVESQRGKIFVLKEKH